MAKELTTKFSVDLSGVVENSIIAVRNIRKNEQARKEAEFQRAIANGLSYEAQISMREAQLEEEKKSSLFDADYSGTLEKSITDTKKLNRFNKYRTRYAESLGELSSGKINEEQYLSVLKTQLNGIDDPELRLEIQGDIATAETKVKTYKDTILSNQVKKAKYDGTKNALAEVISKINTARAQALISDNQDEVIAYDETLSALNSQLSSTRIQDSITDFQVKSSTRGVNPVEKLNYINSEIQKSDPNTAIKIGDRTYASAQQFWSLERDNFLAGSSQIFGKFFDELSANVKNSINEEGSKFLKMPQFVLDNALTVFNEVRSRPEAVPFLDKLNSVQSSIMSEAVDKVARQIYEVGSQQFDFENADIQLQNFSTRYGVNVDTYRTALRNQNVAFAKESAELLGKEEAEKRTITTDLPIPKIDLEKPVVLETPVKPTETPTPIPTPIPTTVIPPVKPKISETIVSTPPASKSAYTGSSIVDYLKSVGQDSSVVSRAKIAVEKGVVKSEDEYLKAAQTNENATMNTKLLESLRKEQ